MNELKKVYVISITINKETTADLGTGDSILLLDSLSYSTEWLRNNWHVKSEVNYDLQGVECLYVNPASGNHKEDLSVISDKALNITGADIQDKLLYRYPDLTLPRSKVDLLKDKYNVKIIRDRTKADYKIISKKYINNMFHGGWQSVYTKKAINHYVTDLNEHLDSQAKASLENFLNKISEDSYFHISINYNWSDNFDTLKRVTKVSNISDIDVISRPLYLTDAVAFKSMSDSNNLVMDSHISKICSEDSVVLTEDQYKSLNSMFKSKDIDNMAVGLEMLANCNIEKSLDKAALLYFKHAYYLRNAKNWNTVNVKTLRSRLEKAGTKDDYNRGMYPYERLFRYLKENDAITEFAYKATIVDISETVFADIGLTKSDIFKLDISDIKLSKEFAVKEVDPNQLSFGELLADVQL
jgi:hypothetical protein